MGDIIKITLLILTIVVTNTFGQENDQKGIGKWNLSIGASIPTGEYANDEKHVNLQASTGLMIQGGYSLPLRLEGLGVYSNLGFSISSSHSPYYDSNSTYLGYKVVKTKFINIPVSLGVDYKYRIGDVGLMVNIGIVNNTLIIPKKEKGDISDYYTSEEFEPENSFGGQIGFSIIYLEKFKLKIDYTKLATSSIDGYYKVISNLAESSGYGHSFEGELSIEKKVEFISLTLGYCF